MKIELDAHDIGRSGRVVVTVEDSANGSVMVRIGNTALYMLPKDWAVVARAVALCQMGTDAKVVESRY